MTLQKKERVITDEVTRSMGGTFASRYAVLDSRRQAIDKINRMFDLNITVDFKDPDQVDSNIETDDNINEGLINE